MFVYMSLAHPNRHRGFTLIELMVTVALAAILAALAAPSLRSFIVRNNFSSMGNEFSGSILRARNEAVSKNMCVTMCMSSTVDTTTGNGPVCKTNDQDWQVGWIVFLNPECNTNLTYPQETNSSGTLVNKPENMLLVRRTGNADYTLMSVRTPPTRRMDFNPRGNSGLISAGRFDLNYITNNQLSLEYGFSICLDAMGRTRSVPSAVVCNSY